MTTARDRYEDKTRVVTFRVPRELYERIEAVKANTGLSNTDLIKLGAEIAQNEVLGKLAELSGLQAKLLEVKRFIHQKETELHDFVNEERSRRLKALDSEMQAYQLFAQGWELATVSYKLGVSQAMVWEWFKEWAERRGDREAMERELLKACVKEHINILEETRMWDAALRRRSNEELEEAQMNINDCYCLLSTPKRIRKEDKEFFITRYSRWILHPSQEKKRRLADSP
ncbi:MAG: hypothetical protein DDT29_01070 [Dehalococcoidia bacterium]|nr:hypothetical protein [Bacillota bacterium]